MKGTAGLYKHKVFLMLFLFRPLRFLPEYVIMNTAEIRYAAKRTAAVPERSMTGKAGARSKCSFTV